MELVLASANEGKVKEIQTILGSKFKLKSLKEIGITDDIPETGNTFHQNALQKAKYVYHKCKCTVLADDSGLEVAVLNGKPGVYSARYAGLPKNDEKNIQLLLEQLKGTLNRQARFVCVLCLIHNDKEYFFEGEIKGTIAEYPKGNNGFGYDPVFIPDGYTQTFAELNVEEKNKISHRYKALEKLQSFLKTI
ncbi:MAG: non-canonical purine NTP pyrophosphatase [Bacteroidia bacterium]|nr:MAG: non-canonical purine NTP pyrophosphatase [Bacteroidia bacterium]